MIRDKEIAALAELAMSRVPVQTVIVNGQEQVIEDMAYALVCPKCKAKIQAYQPGVPELAILKELQTSDESLLNSTVYCSKCGQKLKLFRETPIEVEVDG